MGSAVQKYKKNAYTGNILFFPNDSSLNSIYVHKHVSNVGKAEGGQPENLMKFMSSYLADGRKEALQNQVQGQYQDLFKQSVSTISPQSSLDVINTIFKDKNSIMEELSPLIQEALDKALDFNKMAELMKKEKAIINKVGRKKLEDFVDDSNTQKGIKNINEILKLLKDAANILFNNDNQVVSLVLQGLMGSKNITEMSSKLKQADSGLTTILNRIEKGAYDGPRSRIEIEQARMIIQKIKAVINYLESKSEPGSNEITMRGFKNNLEQIFSKGFGEAVAGEIKDLSFEKLQEKMVKAAVSFSKKSGSMTGAESITVKAFDANGEEIDSRKYLDFQKASAGKADYKNGEVQIEIIKNGQKYILNLDLGVSVKFYRTRKFLDANGKNITNSTSMTFGSGSAGSLKEALMSLFFLQSKADELRDLYMAYNIVGHSKEGSAAIAMQELRQLILIKQIIRAFVSRGGQSDFAQYFLANGKLYQTWDIVKLVTTSQASAVQKHGISLQLNVKPVQDATKQSKVDTLTRVRNINEQFQKVKIQMSISLFKFNNYLKNR